MGDPILSVYPQTTAVDSRTIDRLLHLYRKEMHGERSMNCNGNRGWRREKLESSLILASQCPFVKVQKVNPADGYFMSIYFDGCL